jgi:hypothetical protein
MCAPVDMTLGFGSDKISRKIGSVARDAKVPVTGEGARYE